MKSLLIKKFITTIRVAPLVLLLGCQFFPVTAAEPTNEANGLEELLDAVIKKYTIHHGGFRKLRTGQTREDALSALGRMNIHSIAVRLRPQQVIEKPEDVHLLQEAEAIALNDFVVVEFSGDDVSRFRTPAIVERFPKDGLDTEIPKQRSEVLDFVRRYLAAYPNAYARSATRLPFHYTVSEGLDQMNGRLLSYPGWSFNIIDGEGWWHLVLWFNEDVLSGIEISFSPIELP